jgi:hypothetical protein
LGERVKSIGGLTRLMNRLVAATGRAWWDGQGIGLLAIAATIWTNTHAVEPSAVSIAYIRCEANQNDLPPAIQVA